MKCLSISFEYELSHEVFLCSSSTQWTNLVQSLNVHFKGGQHLLINFRFCLTLMLKSLSTVTVGHLHTRARIRLLCWFIFIIVMCFIITATKISLFMIFQVWLIIDVILIKVLRTELNTYWTVTWMVLEVIEFWNECSFGCFLFVPLNEIVSLRVLLQTFCNCYKSGLVQAVIQCLFYSLSSNPWVKPHFCP